jgi:hypothetical protein
MQPDPAPRCHKRKTERVPHAAVIFVDDLIEVPILVVEADTREQGCAPFRLSL